MRKTFSECKTAEELLVAIRDRFKLIRDQHIDSAGDLTHQEIMYSMIDRADEAFHEISEILRKGA